MGGSKGTGNASQSLQAAGNSTTGANPANGQQPTPWSSQQAWLAPPLAQNATTPMAGKGIPGQQQYQQQQYQQAQNPWSGGFGIQNVQPNTPNFGTGYTGPQQGGGMAQVSTELSNWLRNNGWSQNAQTGAGAAGTGSGTSSTSGAVSGASDAGNAAAGAGGDTAAGGAVSDTGGAVAGGGATTAPAPAPAATPAYSYGGEYGLMPWQKGAGGKVTATEAQIGEVARKMLEANPQLAGLKPQWGQMRPQMDLSQYGVTGNMSPVTLAGALRAWSQVGTPQDTRQQLGNFMSDERLAGIAQEGQAWADKYQKALDAGTTLDGKPLGAGDREAMEREIALGRQLVQSGGKTKNYNLKSLTPSKFRYADA